MQSNGQRVIAIPELLAMIVHELDSKEQHKLMCISRYLFHSVGPTAWKSVPRLDLLMRLIKDVQIEIVDIVRGRTYIDRAVIKVPLSLDLGRYNIYAPWVQELEIYGGCYQQVEALDPFLVVLDGRPPLPNLRRLTAYNIPMISFYGLLRLFNMFMNPSLTEIRTIVPKEGFQQVTDVGMSSSIPAFLEKLKNTCPEIQVLEFYLEKNDSDWSEESMLSDRSWSALASFVNLCSFSSSSYVLKPPIFRILGELPHLESLGIEGSGAITSVLDKQLSIPETWFPVLKDLRLYDIDYEDIQVLWSQPNIVKKLVSTQIQTSVTYSVNWAGPFLKALPRLSPRLEDVVFSMRYRGRMTEIPRDHWHDLEGERLLMAYIVCMDAMRRGHMR